MFRRAARGVWANGEMSIILVDHCSGGPSTPRAPTSATAIYASAMDASGAGTSPLGGVEVEPFGQRLQAAGVDVAAGMIADVERWMITPLLVPAVSVKVRVDSGAGAFMIG